MTIDQSKSLDQNPIAIAIIVASRTKQETTQKNSSLTPCQHFLQKSTHIFDDAIFVNYLTILTHPRKHLRHLGPILGMTSRIW